MIDRDALAAVPSLLHGLVPDGPGEAFSIGLDADDIAVMKGLVKRLHDTDPYYSPSYIGHMSSYVHPLASTAYFLAMQLNCNNHSYDGGRATTLLERECIAGLAGMFQWDAAQGHLCSGGTVANLEALWVARERGCEVVIAASHAHYCHRRAASILGMRFIEVGLGAHQHMDVDQLQSALQNSPRSVVVATCGTTAVGAVDPIADLLQLCSRYHARLHVDAAYGGYYRLLAGRAGVEVSEHFRALDAVDSIVIDPHKHGLQGFGCGAIVFREVDQHAYRHDAPYTYAQSQLPHLGHISLECSRPGAVAAALWATMQRFPLVPDGVFANRLASCRSNALGFYHALGSHSRYEPVHVPETDIVCFGLRGDMSLEDQRRIVGSDVGRLKVHGIYVATVLLDGPHDSGQRFCIRCAMMKPEHALTYPKILQLLG